MNDLASLVGLLLTVGTLTIPIAVVLWLVRGPDSTAGAAFELRFDDVSRPVPEEVDPPRWRIERIGQSTRPSGHTTAAGDERAAFISNSWS